MKKVNIKSDPQVKQKFQGYPEQIKEKLGNLRNLILETAGEIAGIGEVEETLKWGEPSYLVKKGSTIRIDWKPKNPDQYAMYFKCTSKLVPTFRQFYGGKFKFEDNRAIVFNMQDTIPEKELKECVALALQYHLLKHLPDLGKSA
ncbi:MAG: DUF1801 domain-containing protein [Saprospiraceae bacterium]